MTWASDKTEILGGKAVILKTRASGDVWQFRMRVSGEKKYVRKSLHTRDKRAAEERAEEIALELLGKIKLGRKVFGITLRELVDAYVDWRQEDVDAKRITAGRLVTIKSQLKHFLAYTSPDLKVGELERQSYYDYGNWRRKTQPATRDVTIRNEQATINHMLAFAYRRDLAHFDKLEFQPIRIKAKDVGKRDTFTLDEYDKLCRYMRTYCSKAKCPDDDERMERLMVRDAVLIASNTMLRVGELWNLKWSDVERIDEEQEVDGQTKQLVTINVRWETSKVRKSRRVITNGGQYFLRLRDRVKPTSEDEYVFANPATGTKVKREVWYKHWGALMKGINLAYKSRNITWYSLRHFGITCRLRSDVSIHDVAKLAGTSVAHIESHYAHYDDKMLRRAALKNFTYTKDGILVRD